MRINTNLIALNTKNQLKKNNKSTSSIMEKLSSGKRINKAADDAAGLAISQKMRAQIRGLDQASENAQDGISLVQTAEGGLSTINNPHLARLRELAIQSANDTLVDSDREKIQMEAEEIIEAIDDIANNTEFNTIKLLSPPVNISEGETKFAKTDVAFIVDVSGSMGGIIDNVVNNLDVFTNTMKSQGVDVNLGLISYSDVNIGEDITTWNLMSDVDIFKEIFSDWQEICFSF
jgi:flagellin